MRLKLPYEMTQRRSTVSPERVAELRAAVAAGTYVVDPRALAELLFETAENPPTKARSHHATETETDA